MKSILAVVSGSASRSHERLAAESIRSHAARRGYSVTFDFGDRAPASAEDVAAAELVIIASDAPVDEVRFASKRLFHTQTAEAIFNTDRILDECSVNEPVVTPPPRPNTSEAIVKRVVAVTSCPTGIAHTFLAAEALKKGAKSLGYSIQVETRGSVGAQNLLTAGNIAEADAVIIAADTKVDVDRFVDKPISFFSTKEAIHDPVRVIKVALARPQPARAGTARTLENAGSSKGRVGAYKHLMTGVSHMLPLVIAGGLSISLAFAVGGIYAGSQVGTLAAALNQIGGGTALHLMVSVLAGFIAFSIADRPGLAPGLVGGMLAQTLGAGFLGGIVAGFLAGYLTRFLATQIRLPAGLEGLKPVLILPLVSTVCVGLLMIYVVAPPVQMILAAFTGWLNTMRGTNAFFLGSLLGAMMAFDMGGPVNKAAYTFGVGLLASKVYAPMAAVMTPPLGIALAVLLNKKVFDPEERKTIGAAALLGLSFITESAIPFAAKDPLRVIPALMFGSAAAGAFSMLFGVQLFVPHGGVFVLLIPGAVTHLFAYIASIAAGSALTAGSLILLRRRASFADTGTQTA